MAEITQAEINKKIQSRDRDVRIMKDKTLSLIARMAIPAIVLLVGVLVFSARELPESSLAVISGLISGDVIGLIHILQGFQVEKEDPMIQIAKSLIEHMTEDSSKEIILDDKSVRIQNKHSKMVAGKNLIYGKDKK